MKLWQKVFLWTLALVIVAVNATSFVLIEKNHEELLETAQAKAQQTYELVTTAVQNKITTQRTESGVLFLTSDEVASAMQSAFTSLTDNKTNIDFAPYESSADSARFTMTMLDNSGSFSHSIKTESVIMVEGKPYRLLIEEDISDIFKSFEEDITYVQYAGTIISIAVAGIMLIIILSVMRPLKKLNMATKEIADGNFSTRIEVKGKSDLSELAENMNSMAQEIEKNVQRIQQLADDRKLFIANMTHELKTPLTSILGFADLLKIKSHVSDKERREYAGIIEEETKRLRFLSSRLMELITIGETPLELRPINVGVVLKEVAGSIKPLLERQKITLDCLLQDADIMAEEALLKSLIYNILDNAVKASASGQSIQLNMEVKENRVMISVVDSGIGISSEQLEHVTKPFYMVDKARTRKSGGAGIGLSLCQAIADAHGGTLKIESEPERGTRVTIMFPEYQDGRNAI